MYIRGVANRITDCSTKYFEVQCYNYICTKKNERMQLYIKYELWMKTQSLVTANNKIYTLF